MKVASFCNRKTMAFIVQQGAFSMSSGYPHGNLEMGIEFALFWHLWHLFYFFFRSQKNFQMDTAQRGHISKVFGSIFLWSSVIFTLFSYKLRSHDHQDRGSETSQVELLWEQNKQSGCHNKRGKHASSNEQSSSTGFFLTLLEA